MTTTPTSEEANDIDHETSDQVTTEPRRLTRACSAPEWYSNPVLKVMLLDHDCRITGSGRPLRFELWGACGDYTFYHRSKGKIFVAKNGSFLEKEFLLKEVTGRKLELDEVIVPSL